MATASAAPAVTGYRTLREDEIALLNEAKEFGEQISRFVQRLESAPSLTTASNADTEVDKRWLAIAKTDLQKGMMSLCRAIARPNSF